MQTATGPANPGSPQDAAGQRRSVAHKRQSHPGTGAQVPVYVGHDRHDRLARRGARPLPGHQVHAPQVAERIHERGQQESRQHGNTLPPYAGHETLQAIRQLRCFDRGIITRDEEGCICIRTGRDRVHEVPQQTRARVELHATTIAHSAKRQGPGRVSGAMYPRPMCTPSANSGKGASTLVAQEAALNLDRGRTLGQINTPLAKHAVKRASPDATQAFVDIHRGGPALNTCKTSQPKFGTAADKRRPG